MQGQGDDKGGALSGRAFYLDRAAFVINDVFDDGQPQTGTLDMIADNFVAAVERVKKLRQAVFVDSDASIADNELIIADMRILGRQLADFKADRTAFRSKFNSVADDIVRNALQMQDVA